MLKWHSSALFGQQQSPHGLSKVAEICKKMTENAMTLECQTLRKGKGREDLWEISLKKAFVWGVGYEGAQGVRGLPPPSP